MIGDGDVVTSGAALERFESTGAQADRTATLDESDSDVTFVARLYYLDGLG